jgi:heme oxygenase (biliverdin-IX-beta and delta-forming)
MTDQGHGRSTPEEPLTPPETKAPTHADRARTLVDGQRTGTLATLTEEGFPYGSYVTFGLDDGAPVFLVSTMAAHTKNLEHSNKCSLLVNESVADDPLANGRVTLVGTCHKLAEPGQAREAFLAAHPQASYYADFKDFAFWRMDVSSVRYIGGYGRMSWVEVDAWSAGEVDPLAPSEAGIVEHMNDDHADALVVYARAFTRATQASEVTMVSCDQHGFELSVVTEKGKRPARIAFPEPVTTGEDARQALIAILKEGRAKLG